MDAQLSSGAVAWRGTVPTDPQLAGVFAGLVEMQLHGAVHPRTLRAAVAHCADPEQSVPPVLLDLLLTVVVRISVGLAWRRPASVEIDRGLVLALVANHERRWAVTAPLADIEPSHERRVPGRADVARRRHLGGERR